MGGTVKSFADQSRGWDRDQFTGVFILRDFSFWYIISNRDRKDTFIDGLRTPIYETAREF